MDVDKQALLESVQHLGQDQIKALREQFWREVDERLEDGQF